MSGSMTRQPQFPSAAIIPHPPGCHPSPTHQGVILNGVKDLRLPLRSSNWRYFRIGDEPPATRSI
jgi:hypothetical protein